MWDLEAARCKFGKYLHVHVNGVEPNIERLVNSFPPRREMTEQGELLRGLPVRLRIKRHAEFGDVTGDYALNDNARFFPTNAALASWAAQADGGSAHIVYE